MPILKNILGIGTMAKFKSLFFRESSPIIDETFKNTTNVTIGLKYKMNI